MINPTIKDYIKDLTYDNDCMFAQNKSLVEKRRKWEKELLMLLQQKVCDEVNNRIFYLIGRIQIINDTYKTNVRMIRENLRKVQGLRNGTIKDI